jgi:hypothetical protein
MSAADACAAARGDRKVRSASFGVALLLRFASGVAACSSANGAVRAGKRAGELSEFPSGSNVIVVGRIGEIAGNVVALDPGVLRPLRLRFGSSWTRARRSRSTSASWYIALRVNCPQL